MFPAWAGVILKSWQVEAMNDGVPRMGGGDSNILDNQIEYL